MGFVLGTTAMGADNKTESKITAKGSAAQYQTRNLVVKPRKQKVLMQLTGSNLPQNVVVRGQQANTASPMYIVGGKDLLRSGSTSIIGILSLDPSITMGRR